MKKIKFRQFIDHIYREVTTSIAFYPTIISVFLFFCGVLIMYVEYSELVINFKSHISILLVTGKDSAITLLSTLSGSIISLTVFSFSMVMIVLNRASATLSPRVIPGLITRKSHQIVLGFYLGTIIYSLILIINIRNAEQEFQIPSLGILISMILGIICLALFVYFIHSISNAIQVDSVLNDLFSDTLKGLKDVKEKQDQNKLSSIPDTEGWKKIKSIQSGYYKGIHKRKLLNILEKENLQLIITINQGFFIVKEYPFIKTNRDISDDEELLEEIYSCFIFYIEEYISDHYHYGLKQISEIAVKAMSPGINDPGTAIKSIDMLCVLLIERLQIEDVNATFGKDDNLLFLDREPTLAKLIGDNFTPVRCYAADDSKVLYNIIEALKNMLYAKNNTKDSESVILEYIQTILNDADHNIKNSYDRKYINEIVAVVRKMKKEAFKKEIEPLAID